MDTFTLSNPYLQKVWGRMPGDWFKAFKPIVMLSLIFCFNIFNSVTQAQSSCPYNISLVSKTYNAATNQTTFVWSVVNPNPGNGNGGNGGNGTVQDLSHWGFLISPCPNPANALSEDDIVRGGTGATANPASHSSLSLGLQDDKSQDCTGGADVLKFDAGTSGTAPTYYSLVLSGNWGTGDLNAYYKSGNRTGCGLCTIAGAGVGCRLPCPTITVSITPNLSQFFANRTVGLSATITGGTGPYTYAWSSTTPGVTFNTASSATPVATIPVGTSTFVINVSVNDANGCPGTATITVGQEQICIPLLTPVLATPIAICPGASTGVITVTNPQAGVSYQLLRDGIAVGAPVIYSSGALSFTGLMTGSYAVRASFGTCNPLTSATAIIVAATVPTPTFGAIGTLCPGATATLTATFPAGTTVTGVVWSGTGVSGNIFTAPATAGNYTVNFSATVNGCPVTGSLTITVASVPAPTFNTIGTLCPGATTTLSATFPAGTTVTAVVWSGTGVSGTTFTAPAAGGTYTITYSATVNGCPVTATRTITVASVPAPVFGTIGTLCPGATATLSATFPAGTTVTGVVWSGTGVSGTTFTAPATPGTYTVNYSATVNGCPVTATISIVVVAAPAPTFGAIGTLCPGATATLTATFPAGTTVTNIVWSGTGVTGNIFTAPATAGNYTVNFSATANGCVVTGSLTITVASVPAPTFGAIGTLCPGATATLTATFPAGTTVTGVTWSGTGVSGSTFTAPAVAGTYTVTYTATVNGCPFTTTRTITVANIPTPVFGTIGALCPGATATLTATFPAGTTVTGVVWSGTGVSGNSFTAPATPGTYTINFSATVNGCPFTGSMTITVVAAPASNFTLQVASGSLCPGGGGSVILTLSGSQIGVSYQLVRDGVNVGAPVPGTGASISFGAQTVAGTYSVIATSTGVVGSICVPCPVIIGPITVAPATLPPPSFAAIPVNVCPGATVPLTATFPAGTTVTNVTWSGTGVSGSVFTAPAAGGNYIVTYSATVNGCPFTSTITITVASVPAPTFGAIGTLCPGATATLTATFPAGTTVTGVVWSGTGVSGNIFTAPATAGNYTVNFSATVNGCPVTGSLIITVANVPAPTFGVIGTLCPGATATLTATFPAGTTVTAVVWTGTGVSGTTFTAPATAGTYTITYSALVNGCPVTATRTITVASVPAPTFGAIGTLCPGATATLTATFPAGTTVASIVWTGTGVSGNIFTAPATAGNYTVNFSATVNGCPVTGSLTITVANVPAPTFGVIGTLCPGATATLTATFPAGTTVTGVVWSGTGVSGTTFTAPATGGSYTVNYSATVNGCPVTGSLTIIVANVPAPTFGVIGTLCPGATATLTATFPAGTTVTNVVWSGTGVSGTTFTAPATAGNYTVNFSATVNGCPVTGSLTITVASVPAPTFNTIGTLCPGATATLSATFPAGTTVTAVVWSGTGVSGTTFTAPATAGTYTITYSAIVNGCPVTATRTITVANVPAPTFGAIGTLCPGATATLTATFPAGTTVASIVWTGTGVSGNIFTAPATAGNYTVNFSATVNGCPVTGSLTITVASVPAPTFNTIGTLCPGATATLSATFPAGTTVTAVVWTGTGVSGTTFTAPATAGTYTITYSAIVNGCPVTATRTITVASVPAPTFGAIGTLCPGATATLTATFPAGTTVASIVWTGTGVSGNIFTAPATAGNYTVNFSATVNGCPVTGSLTITVANVPAPTFGVIGTLCPGATATLTATFPAGTTVTGVVWSGTGVSGNIFTAPATAGNYTVNFSATVNGCPVTGSLTITVANVPAPTFGVIGTLCPGATATLTATFPAGTTVTGVVWSGTGVSGTTFTAPATAGNYTVNFSATVNGCPVTGSLTITVANVPAPTFGVIGTLCPGATATLTATFPAGTTVTAVVWSGTGVSGTTFTAPATAGTYTITYSALVNGCPVTATRTITVASVPAPTFGAIGSLCPGATATLTATFPAGTTVASIVWTGTGVSGNIFTAPEIAGTYTISFSATVNGCPVTGTLSITVVAAPAILNIVGTNFCPGGTGTITVQNIQAGVSYQVRLVGGATVGAAQSGAAGTNLLFTNIPAGTYQVVATNTSTGCITVFGNVTIAQTVVTPCVITGPTSVCMGSTNTYTVQTGPGVTSIQWSLQGGNCIIVGTATTPTVTIKAIGPGTFIIRVTVMYGNCPTTCELTVTSTPLAVSAPDVIVCPNSTITLVGSPTGGVWASTNSQIQAALNNTNSTFNSTGIPAGNYPVTYTVTQANGCTGTALGSITVLSAGVFGGLAGRLSSTNSSIMEVRMDKSTKGVIYQLMRNGSRVGSPVNGTGSAINFGTYDVTGDYSVTASTKDGDCSTTTDGGRIVPTGISPVERVGNVEVSAFPNPFSDQIRFTIESDVTGQGVLEVYTILGAKLRTVYQGHIEAGKKVNVDFAVPGPQRVHMIYKMRVGNTQTTGKLINVK